MLCSLKFNQAFVPERAQSCQKVNTVNFVCKAETISNILYPDRKQFWDSLGSTLEKKEKKIHSLLYVTSPLRKVA